MTHPDPHELGLNSTRRGFSTDKEAPNKRAVEHAPMRPEFWWENSNLPGNLERWLDSML